MNKTMLDLIKTQDKMYQKKKKKNNVSPQRISYQMFTAQLLISWATVLKYILYSITSLYFINRPF